MSNLFSIICNDHNHEECANRVADEFEKGSWVILKTKNQSEQFISSELPPGPGIIIRGGGSTGSYQQCLHHVSHLNQSAIATSQWLKGQGLNPVDCQILNALPLHHVSGLLPWWRSRCWGAKHIWIEAKTMHNPSQLEEKCNSLKGHHQAIRITSLVPTQLTRLIKSPAGVRWLQSCSIIWVGGAPISKALAKASRALNLRLAPCYGTTETTAMVTIQTPEDFLTGQNSSGEPLNDIELRLGTGNTLQIRTQRLAKCIKADGTISSIANEEGWWESGDVAELLIQNHVQQLKIIGRQDTAINSGGEIIFPEKLQVRLLDAAIKRKIAIEAILLTTIKDEEWGERLIALVRLKNSQNDHDLKKSFASLKQIVKEWSSIERPSAWYHCPALSTNILGKWEINKWKSWVIKLNRTNTSM
ncbi:MULTISPECIES: AMP-binding protein [Prochlorococcus]|uniref:O-succinylbenzoate-CoA ligase n=2 Tax=Prochlorococcus marinus TaxID=1219 RepID=Q7VE15_PROMA|nr:MULTISPECIES: AMP-binding protein [Prochlorococcus]AAP99245.1 O-succinylbenzoate-CoA ligase [Prochlorococcus marinus subsp. marinus str. CCMP1375]KGG18560.1 O-succinylbenzoic acid--CoA ligase [Prochlorococcus marinus str. SS2]KGG22833.1 O-succinylbenzoic acid--CoA ligase [Prochlorococcus marinus str. SS35]KGG32709.1 O-succinylbenzoic acid--CoA ligase [Prochlorococcus marinus str. SS51]